MGGNLISCKVPPSTGTRSPGHSGSSCSYSTKKSSFSTSVSAPPTILDPFFLTPHLHPARPLLSIKGKFANQIRKTMRKHTQKINEFDLCFVAALNQQSDDLTFRSLVKEFSLNETSCSFTHARFIFFEISS